MCHLFSRRRTALSSDHVTWNLIVIGCQFRTETDGFGSSAAGAPDLERSPVDQTNPRSSEMQHTHVMSDRWII